MEIASQQPCWHCGFHNVECFSLLLDPHMTPIAVVEVWLNDEVPAVGQLTISELCKDWDQIADYPAMSF